MKLAKVFKTIGGNELEEQEYETIDLREILLLLKKNLLGLIAVTILFAVVGYLISAFLLTPKYEASATMIVNSREDTNTQTNITSDQINSATKLVDTYSVILTSDTVLDKTIEDLGLDMDYEDLLKKVTVESVNATQVMKISAEDEDPQLAQQIVASIVEQAPEIIIQTVKAGSVEVISQSKVADEPVSPKKMMNRNNHTSLILTTSFCGKYSFFRGVLRKVVSFSLYGHLTK